MIYDSKSNTIKKQITKNLIGLEMSRFYQVALFRPFLTQQNQRNWRDVYICQEKKTLSSSHIQVELWSVCVSRSIMSDSPGSSVHGILQARMLEWVAILFSRGSSQPRNQTPISLHYRQILYCLSHQGSCSCLLCVHKKDSKQPSKG